MRTARYYLDLCRRYPQDEILPIALVDDEAPRELSDTIERGAQGTKKFFALWVVEAGLGIEQQRQLDRRLKEMDMPEIIEWWVQEGLDKGREDGFQQGLHRANLENARKMLSEGFEWSVITRITGLCPGDLQD